MQNASPKPLCRSHHGALRLDTGFLTEQSEKGCCKLSARRLAYPAFRNVPPEHAALNYLGTYHCIEE
jgi:hypothetical protein